MGKDKTTGYLSQMKEILVWSVWLASAQCVAQIFSIFRERQQVVSLFQAPGLIVFECRFCQVTILQLSASTNVNGKAGIRHNVAVGKGIR